MPSPGQGIMCLMPRITGHTLIHELETEKYLSSLYVNFAVIQK